ncbi:MAG: UDP-N-acetylmuramoyl-L-alanine--D-glutamate ligase [Candidatus Marinimicrobia bacterium]|nr:UDP-N-acetylmuramoyl-L-alanine--D-glutamate ligase [Candidatus Neomarinimicrobiota bacterium]
MQPVEIKNKRVTILGAERSGLGAAKLLAQHGAKLLVSENDALKFTAEKRELLASLNAKFEFGYHSDDVFDADFIVVSPGIPENAEIMEKLRAKQIPMYSEVEVASWFINEPIIAVTGSNGKTTTVNLIHHVLKSCGINSFLGGNVGQAISEVILARQSAQVEQAVFVLEVSSFQLDHVEKFHPNIALILNLSPDHLDRYDSAEAYYASKYRIWDNLDSGDVVGYNVDDERLEKVRKPAAQILGFGTTDSQHLFAARRDDQLGILQNGIFQPVLPVAELPIPGPHNVSNALACITAVSQFVSDGTKIGAALKTFTPVPHRIEYVDTIKGIRFYNDSKATNVASTAVAIQSFSEPEWVILGGKDKGGEFYTLAMALARHARKVLLVGKAAPIIARQLDGVVEMETVGTIDNAIDYALQYGHAGDVVLLSPGCASFDQFDNYEKRGEFFISIVKQRKEQLAP